MLFGRAEKLQARSVLGIPIPKVLGYSVDATNSVGSEYILMEEAKGVQLASVWNDMEIDDQAKIVKSIIEIDAKFLAISLDRCAFLAGIFKQSNRLHLQIWSHILRKGYAELCSCRNQWRSFAGCERGRTTPVCRWSNC